MRRSFTGSNGWTNSHNSSETIHGAAAIGTPPSLTTDADGVRRQRAGPFITKGALSAVLPPSWTVLMTSDKGGDMRIISRWWALGAILLGALLGAIVGG